MPLRGQKKLVKCQSHFVHLAGEAEKGGQSATWVKPRSCERHALVAVLAPGGLARDDDLDPLADDDQALLEHIDLLLARQVLGPVFELFLREEGRGKLVSAKRASASDRGEDARGQT